MRADELARLHLDSGIDTYERLGGIVPAAWASGSRGSLVASPYRQDALEQAAAGQITGVLVMLAAATGADIIGSTAEAWVRAATSEEEAEGLGGSLEARAEWDPEVRTAIVAHAIEIASARQALAVGVECVEDDGSRSWQIEEHSAPDGSRADALLYASAAVIAFRGLADGEEIALGDAARWLDALGWLCGDIG